MTDLSSVPQPDIRKLVSHLQRRWTDQVEEQIAVNPTVYYDPEFAAEERTRVFGRCPVAICHSSELAEPGAFLTTRLPNNQVLVVRQEDGSVQAFVNACRHRGATLEEGESGVCSRRFQCPYHGWSYNLDGSLRSATHEVSFGEFDHIAAGLVRLPAQERHGFIWVIDGAGHEIDVAAWLGPETDAILGSYGIDSYVCVKSGHFDVEANWKVLYDAFLDGYHIQFVHRETANKLTYTNILTLDDYGRHSRFLSPRKKLGKLLEEHGGNADELTDAEIMKYTNVTHGLLPNATLLYLPDQIQLLSFFPHPKDPAMSRMEMRIIVRTAEDLGWDDEKWQSIWDRNWKINLDVIHDEDLPISRGTQRALESADAGPLIIGRNEVGNQVFHRELRRLIAEQ